MEKRFKTFTAIFLLVFCAFRIHSKEPLSYLESYFGDNNFKTEIISICGRKIYLSVNYKDSERQIFDKAVIYELPSNKNEVYPYIKFSENKIETNNTVLFSSDIKGKQFYGWKINVTEKTGYIHTIYYCENGKNVTEGISLIWDSNKGIFKYIR